jgi:hypothetical protein
VRDRSQSSLPPRRSRRLAAALVIGLVGCIPATQPDPTSVGTPAPSPPNSPAVTPRPEPTEDSLELVGVVTGGLLGEPLVEVDLAAGVVSFEPGTPLVVVQRAEEALLVLPPGGTGLSAAWIPAATEDGTATVEELSAPCPPGDATIGDLIDLGGLGRFCGPAVAFDGYVPGFCGIAGGLSLVAGSPDWLYGSAPWLWVYAEQPSDPLEDANPPASGLLAVRVAPTIPIANCDEQRARRWYAFTAHFDDPASVTCRATWSGRTGPVADPPAVAEAACRMTIVVDSARPIPAP